MKQSNRLNYQERGVALFLCLFALLLLSSIAMGLMYMANSETTINYNYRTSVQSFYAARAGAMEGVDRLRAGDVTANYSITPPITMPSKTASTGVTYIINPGSGETVAPWDPTNAYFDDELCHEQFLDSSSTPLLGVAMASLGVRCAATVNPSSTYYTSINSVSPYSGTTPYKWARITLKQNGTNLSYPVNGSSPLYSKVCWDGSNERTLSSLTGYTDCDSPPSGGTAYSNVYVITAMANAGATSVTNTGARRMYQVEYAPAPPVTANAAVASKAGVNLTGNLQVIGYDQCTCKLQSGSYVARYNGGTCNNTTSSIYSAGVVDNPNNSETVVGPVGDQHGIQESIGANNWPASLNIDTLINSFKPGSISVATQSSGSWNLNNGTNILGPFPTTAQLSDPALIAMSGQVSYIGGSIQLGGSGSNTFPSQCQGACGSGVLIVDGDLTIHGGGFQWYGLILVRGTVTFQGGGSAGTNIYGAVIAGQDTNANTDTTLGGSVNIQLDKCAISNSMKARPLTYISSRELLY